MRNVYSVSQVNAYIKNMFSEDYLLHSILVRGEVSNCKYHSSGHIYFTLKDASGTLSCVMFAGRRRGLSFRMQEGDQVIVAGAVDVYVRDGRYQLYAEQVIRDGVGALNERFEKLKRRLEEEGMFDERYKQPIPKYIRTLGVVTAPTGAAVRDIINISLRRDPYLQIILYPAIVQGDQAKDSIINGIHALEMFGVDTMIIGRGGGSIEDLWAFNEEAVAEAVFNCTVPIISAVGHETDTVITDYVADLRAPTPSAAAELAVFDYNRFVQDLDGYRAAMEQNMRHRLGGLRETVKRTTLDLVRRSPENRMREQRMFLVQMQERLQTRVEKKIEQSRRRADLANSFETQIRRDIERAKTRTKEAAQIRALMEKSLSDSRNRMQLLAASLEQMSPVARLSGGYGFVTDADGRNVHSVRHVHPGDLLSVRLADGRIEARVEKSMTDSELEDESRENK